MPIMLENAKWQGRLRVRLGLKMKIFAVGFRGKENSTSLLALD